MLDNFDLKLYNFCKTGIQSFRCITYTALVILLTKYFVFIFSLFYLYFFICSFAVIDYNIFSTLLCCEFILFYVTYSYMTYLVLLSLYYVLFIIFMSVILYNLLCVP